MVDLAVLQSVSYIAGAFGVCVAAFYYVMTLRVQQNNMKYTLETRKADILQRVSQINSSQEFAKSWHDVYHNQNFLTIDEWREKYGADHPEHYVPFVAMLQHHQILGGLLKDGLVSVELVE